jgi:hypothetical protein
VTAGVLTEAAADGTPRLKAPVNAAPAEARAAAAPGGGVVDVAHITTKQDMSRWTRAHADAAGITWSVTAGPGGTMVITEYDRARSAVGDGPRSATTRHAAQGGDR